MFSFRNIHFAILGVIIGGVLGYIVAFYQAQKNMPVVEAASGSSASGHPDVSNEQMLTMFQEALQKNPDNEELLVRYGNFLFDIDRFEDAIGTYQKVLKIDPKNIDVQTDMGTAFLNLGNAPQALEEYEKSIKADPNHILTLHNLFIYDIEVTHDLDNAAQILARIEQVNPQYPPLASLHQKLDEERARKK